MLIGQARRNHVLRGLLAAAAVVIVIAGLRAARPVLVPMLVAAFVALACVPMVHGLRRRRVPNGVAVAVAVLVATLLFTGVALFVGSSLTDFVLALPAYETRLRSEATGVFAGLARLGLDIPDQGALLNRIDPAAALGLAATLFDGLRDLLTNGVLILLTVVFILLEVSTFRAKLQRAFDVPGATFPPIAAFMQGMKQYFVIKTAVSLITGTAVAVWLAILGIDFPLLWGLLAFLLNYIPNIGSIVAAIPPMLLALVQVSPGSALLVGLGYLVVNMVMGNFIEPRWMGHGVGLSPLVVFLSLVFWGWILGPVGLLLSVPLTMTLKIAFESSDETRWLAVLIGPEKGFSDAPELERAGIDPDALDAAAEAEERHFTEPEPLA